jgi:hypothetical protein
LASRLVATVTRAGNLLAIVKKAVKGLIPPMPEKGMTMTAKVKLTPLSIVMVI